MIKRIKNKKENNQGLLFILFIIAFSSYRLLEEWFIILTDIDSAPFLILLITLIFYTGYKYYIDKKSFWDIEQWLVLLLLIITLFGFN